MLLRTRINLVAVTATIIVAMALTMIGALALNESDGRFKDATISGKSVLWKKIISSQLDQMEAASRSLSRDSDTLEALRDANLEELSENAITTYNLLSTSEVLSRLQLTNLEGRVLFSEPIKFTGYTKKYLVKKTLSEGKVTRGIEMDDDGKMVAVLNFPLYIRGKMIGAGVYARDLLPALEDFKLNNNAESLIVNGNGDTEYSTNTEMFKNLNADLPEIGNTSQEYIVLDEKAFSIVTFPIQDAKGEPLGHLVSANDHTKSYFNQKKMIYLSYVVGTLAIVLIILALSFYLKYSFKPLDSVVEVMRRIAQGDLSSNIKLQPRQDEIGRLLTALHDMNTKLRKIVNDVRISADQTGMITEELARGNLDLSKRTEEQAASLEETASHMEEITSTVRQNVDNANHVDRLAMEARNKTVTGVDVIIGATVAMDEISASSHKITDIITVIEGIAFQTNLLALNAAVEAAHAGTRGLGFKVVADEVRNLSRRSSDAAKEIKALIKEMVDVVKVGEGKVNQSKSILMEIDISIEEVSNRVNEIATASEEQSQGLEQVNEVMAQMDDMTQKNAALVEEASATSHSLDEQAVSLNKIVGLFKLSKLDQDPDSINTDQNIDSSDSVPDIDKMRKRWARGASKTAA